LLPLTVGLPSLWAMPEVAIALDGETAVGTFHHNVDSVAAD
jgi:hypothetical protein